MVGNYGIDFNGDSSNSYRTINCLASVNIANCGKL